MERKCVFALLLAGVVGLPAPVVADSAFGPPDWPEYRLNTENNAAFDSGAPALPDASYKIGPEVRATPVIVGDRLYIGTHETGGMFALNVRTGEKLWDSKSPYWRHAPNWIHSDMIYVHGRIYVGYGNRAFTNGKVRGTGESGVMAVNPKTGATIWNHSTVGEVMPTPAYWHGEILAATGSGEVLALRANSGKALWHVQLPGWVSMSSPNIKDGVLYVGSLNSVVAVDLKHHKKLWEYDDIGSFTDISPAISDSGVVVITAMKSRFVLTPEEKKRWPDARQDLDFIYGLDARSGKLLWKRLMGYGPDQTNNTAGAPAIDGDRVYVGSPYTDSVFCYDVRDGQKIWEYRVNAAVKGAPAIKNGLVFFGDTQGFLHVVDAATGDRPRGGDGLLVSKLKLGGSQTAAKDTALAPGGPVVMNQDVFVGSQDGYIYRVSIPAWLKKK